MKSLQQPPKRNMSSLLPVDKTLHASSTSTEDTPDIIGGIWSQGGIQSQGLTPGSDFDMTEISDFGYSHLQFDQAQMEPGFSDAPDTIPPPGSAGFQHAACSTGISPNLSSQAIDLSTSTSSYDHGLVTSGEKTPVFYGEVPSFVLARIKGSEESPKKATVKTREFPRSGSISAARVCLEKRFNSMCADDATRQPDSHSAVHSNYLPVIQPSAEAQEAFTHPQTQKWLKADHANPFKVSGTVFGGIFEPMTNVFGQVIAHVAEPNIHQGLIIPPSFTFNFHPGTSVIKAVFADSSSLNEEQQFVFSEMDAAPNAVYRGHCSSLCSDPTKAAKTASKPSRKARRSGCKRAKSCMSQTQRKERHNRVERERRKRIRLCCDELNTMVPFCDSNTDKVTTLQWTTAFLRYIKHMYGDSFKEEFQTTFIKEKGRFLKSGPSSVQQPSYSKTDKTLSTSLGAEQ